MPPTHLSPGSPKREATPIASGEMGIGVPETVNAIVRMAVSVTPPNNSPKPFSNQMRMDIGYVGLLSVLLSPRVQLNAVMRPRSKSSNPFSVMRDERTENSYLTSLV